MTSQDQNSRKAPPTGWIVIGLVAAFAILGAILWMNWSADDDSAADNDTDAVVQPARLPDGSSATSARPENDLSRDATGDAAARGREAEAAPAA